MRAPVSSPRCKVFVLGLFATLVSGGCANLHAPDTPTYLRALEVDVTSHRSISQDSRAQHLVLHFTTINNEASIRILTLGAVSSHYLVTEPENGVPPKIYQFVPEHRRAFHAGVSHWKGAAGLNASSIGIEIVGKGYTDTPEGRIWHDFPREQIDLVIALTKGIVKEHQIRPDRIVGHSDIAPGRKNDPGPKFPWKRFADEGIIPWPDEGMVAAKQREFEVKLPDVTWLQQKLTAHGFNVPVTNTYDQTTKNAVEAFQMKYRQTKFDGVLDAETAALLDVATRADGFRVRSAVAEKKP